MNWTGTARSNYFRVKDEAAFRARMDDLNVTVEAGADEHAGMVAAFADDGDWPSMDYENDTEVDFVTEVAAHLADGEVCVLMQSGNEGRRYVSGNAIAFDRDMRFVQVNLDEIYERARALFQVTPTPAEY